MAGEDKRVILDPILSKLDVIDIKLDKILEIIKEFDCDGWCCNSEDDLRWSDDDQGGE